MEITTAKIEEMDVVRTLFREYQQWLGVDLCFQNFEKKLNELPGCYKEPEGTIFLAKEGGEVVGCIAIRPRTGREAELKRLYITPKTRGKGCGKLLLVI
jgi:putative acetyltransferase